MKKYSFKIKGLDCATCANELEQSFKKIDSIHHVSVNFVTENLTFECLEEKKQEILEEMQKIIEKDEPEVTIKEVVSHDHEEGSPLVKILISIFLFVLSFFITIKILSNLILFFAYLLVGYDVLLKAFQNIRRRKIFDENFLMALATIGALFIGEFPEAVAVMLFYQIGEFFQDYAVDQSRKSIASLMDIRPDYANVFEKGNVKKVDPSLVKVGDLIFVKPGEKIPLDGEVVEGKSLLDTKALTGEPVPRHIKEGDFVLSGCVNQEGLLKIQVQKEYGESTVHKILELVENASNRKSKSENFISKFAQYYTPIVVFSSLFLAILPPLFLKDTTFSTWIYRALSFLVVSCPCALVISIPLSFFGGIGAASKLGILIKGSNYLEALSHTEMVVCDKTGTLTEGVFEVQEVLVEEGTKEELLEVAAHAECYSNHPIASSLKKAYGKNIDETRIQGTSEIAGEGIMAWIDHKEVLLGNEKLMKKYDIPYSKKDVSGTILFLAIDKQYVGMIVISDKIKEDSYKMVEKLHKNSIDKIYLLTGDHKKVSEDVSKKLGLKGVYAELLPQDKVEIVKELLKKKKGMLVFLGDGMNDAPVLALSDIGIAMGKVGSDAAIEASDVVLMTDEPSKIGDAIFLSKKTMKIVRENIFFALFVKLVVLITSACGLTSMWLAVFADVGVSILAVLNSLRMLRVKVR